MINYLKREGLLGYADDTGLPPFDLMPRRYLLCFCAKVTKIACAFLPPPVFIKH